MVKDRTIFRIGLFLAVLCMAGGLFFRYKYHLYEPVFVQNEKAVAIRLPDGRESGQGSGQESGWYAELTVRYITDEQNDKIIEYAEFPELGGTACFGGGAGAAEPLHDVQEQYGQYYLHTVTGRVTDEDSFRGDRALVTTGEVTYTDGSTQSVDLGEIVFLNAGEHSAQDSAAEGFVPGISDSSGKEEQILRPEADGTVSVKEVLFPDTMNDLFVITLNGTEFPDFSSETLKAGEAFTVECRKGAASLLDDGFTDRRPAMLLEVDYGAKKRVVPYIYRSGHPSGFEKSSCYKIWRYLDRRGVFR